MQRVPGETGPLSSSARACTLDIGGRGAVELIIASVGLKLGIIDDRLFSILVVIAFITTLLPPILLNYFINKIDEDALQLID